MIQFFNSFLIILCYQIYLKIKAEVQNKVFSLPSEYHDLVVKVVLPSFVQNPFFYCFLLVQFPLFVCRNFLKRLKEYRATLYQFSNQTYFDTLIHENSTVGVNFSELHFFPRLEKREFDSFQKTPELEVAQLESDLIYITQVEATVVWLENCEKIILLLMMVFWLGKASLLNPRFLFS